jgi:methylenetetrahydrofolate dehydrogenase (NADP+)/methenyltetrahydrofolate cyclohydrolase
MSQIINGKEVAAKMRQEISQKAAILLQKQGIKPNLVVIIVGNNPASLSYVHSKEKAAIECGFDSSLIQMQDDISEDALLAEIIRLNNDKNVHGILVQLPLPKHISTEKVIETISPAKDVDGFHPINSGRLMNGQRGMIPCTPKGCMILLKTVCPNLSGKNALVIGRSNIVGKPMAQLLLQANCTVTIAHSKTNDLETIAKSMDIIIAAIGIPLFLGKKHVREGAIIIDVGINRLESGKLVGDVNFDEVKDIAGAITPVPGGVGPMTIACLLENTLEAASLQY